MNKFSILAAILLPLSAGAAELPNVPVGPLDFNEAPTREAVRQILAGTDIIPNFRLPPAGSVTAKGVSGPLPDVMKRLSESVGFTYEYKDKVLTVAAIKPVTTIEPTPQAKVIAETAKKPMPEKMPILPVVKVVEKTAYKIKLQNGKSVKSILSAACIENGYALTWKGQDLFAKYDASFENKTFEEAVNSLLLAVQTAGYIPKGGKDIYVVVQ